MSHESLRHLGQKDNSPLNTQLNTQLDKAHTFYNTTYRRKYSQNYATETLIIQKLPDQAETLHDGYCYEKASDPYIKFKKNNQKLKFSPNYNHDKTFKVIQDVGPHWLQYGPNSEFL